LEGSGGRQHFANELLAVIQSLVGNCRGDL
jgi:hypothetical protein